MLTSLSTIDICGWEDLDIFPYFCHHLAFFSHVTSCLSPGFPSESIFLLASSTLFSISFRENQWVVNLVFISRVPFWPFNSFPHSCRKGFPHGSDGKESACNVGDPSLIPELGRLSWRKECLPTPVFLPGEFHGQRKLMGYNPWGHKELDMTEWLILLSRSCGWGHIIHSLFSWVPRFKECSLQMWWRTSPMPVFPISS